MKKDDLVILPTGRFICVGIHPHGDSMALLPAELLEFVDVALPEDFCKADEDEFRWNTKLHAWVW
ncbi:MAG: hypothetical protein DDT21_01879 [Syntrophomonadaceae bacterium]|nr:hypothetical protein [Bacillota bacterium]